MVHDTRARANTPGALLLTALCTLGCDGEGPGANGPPAASTAGRCEAPRAVACTDQAITILGLREEINPAPVTNQPLGGGVFESRIDASGGGITPKLAFVYARFGPQGLQKVNLGDDGAFSSMAWDIGFRRYIIRTNGGASGPSCVDAALSDRPFESLSAVPAALGYESDLFLEPPACTPQQEGSGLGAPITAIADYYSYQSCLVMTEQAFVLRLRDGRNVALQILGYYPDTVQAFCNVNGRLPPGASGAAQFRLRWKFLPAAD